MKMKISKALLIAPMLGLLAMPVLASHDSGYSKFDRRLDRQSERIEQGVQSGELTRKEAKVLWKQHRKITKAKDKFLRDGDISRKERRVMKNKLDKASDTIYALKHNDKTRGHGSQHRSGKHGNYSGGYSKHHEYSRHDQYSTRSHYVDNNDWLLILRLWDF